MEQRQYLYRQRGVTLRVTTQGFQLTRARGELPWLADLPAQSAQQVLRQLDRAYDNWWNPEHPAGPPTFKKRRNRLAVPFPGQAVKLHKLNRRWAQVWLPKVGWVRFRLSDESSPRLLPPTLTAGEQRRLLGLERRMARQVRWARRHNRGRYSRRLRRTISEIARLKARQARRRLDFTHKLTIDLAKSHGWVGIEDLRVRNMTHSAKGTVLAPGRRVTA